MVNFDWHGAMKDLKEEGTVEALWSVLAAILPQVSLCTPAHPASHTSSCAASPHSPI